MARIAKSLATLREQVNEQYPNRSKSSDGWIGDSAHAARKSDHNPNSVGVVQALDLTNDPAHGFDAGNFARTLISNRDRRIKYIISNGQIAYSSDWKWVKYAGSNAHTKHCHVSVSNSAALYDDPRSWIINVNAQPTPEPKPPPPAIIHPKATDTYPESLRRLLIHEGGYSNHPSDPGGATNYGITIHDYRKYINSKGTASDVRRMTVDQAKTIYRSKYWNAIHCDALPAGVDYAVFDYGVNSGIGRSPKVLQRIVGVTPDGAIGPITLAAVWKHPPKDIINRLCDERMVYLRGLKTWPTFGRGWTTRVTEVRSAALAMADGENVAAAPVHNGMPEISVEIPPVPQAKETVLAPGFWEKVKVRLGL